MFVFTAYTTTEFSRQKWKLQAKAISETKEEICLPDQLFPCKRRLLHVTACAEPEGGTEGPDPPEQSQKHRVS